MKKIKVQLRDEIREFDAGVTTLQIAESISEGLARVAVCGKIDGDKLVDLKLPIESDCKLDIITNRDAEYQEIMRHSCAHVLAQAIKTIYPSAQLTIGPAIDEGYYYDIDFKTPVTVDDLPKIEAEMQKIIKANFEIVRSEVSKEEAVKLFSKQHNNYKLEILEAIPSGEKVTIYTQGEFFDLCRGPHLKSTGMIKAFKLTKLAGAYWRGDSKNKMLTRIYGVCFDKKSELEEYFVKLEEAKQRDHRKLGKDLGIFMFNDLVGRGLPMWLPNGFTVRRALNDYIIDKELALGYKHVMTPSLATVDLYKTSGHWDHYHDDMFPVMERDEEAYVLRPMNCPHHMMIYKNALHSYKDLPLRLAEVANDFRFEGSGALCGIERARAFTQNDSHIFCTPEQIKAEVEGVIALILDVYKDFGFKDYQFRLSLRDVKNKEKYFGNDKLWEKSEKALREILISNGAEFYEAVGEAAFYGPKIDVQVKSALGHDVTLSTIQLDYQLPERFELEYVNENNEKERPVVIHRAILGSLDRFTAFLLEETKGVLPVWLAPVQIKIIPVSDKSLEYSKGVSAELRRAGFRVEDDFRAEKMGYKIRAAQLEKVPYMIIIGENEVASNKISVRKRSGEELKDLDLGEFICQLKSEVDNKK